MEDILAGRPEIGEVFGPAAGIAGLALGGNA
jgi:hypothetical protein